MHTHGRAARNRRASPAALCAARQRLRGLRPGSHAVRRRFPPAGRAVIIGPWPATTDSPARRRRRRRRRRLPALLVIVAAGLLAIIVAFALATLSTTTGPTARTHRSLDLRRQRLARDGRQGRGHRRGQRRLAAIARDGSVIAPRLDEGFIAEAKRKDCRVFVTLTDYDETQHTFDPAISAAILTTRRRAAATPRPSPPGAGGTTSRCRRDWEAVKGARRDQYSAFVEELADRLHADDRLIAVDVYPKVKEPGGWDGPRAQDWERLGRAVDQFRVMTYNYSGSWSGPGPLSPPDWMDRVLDFAESQVPPRRIVMGLGFYGRDWRGSTTTDLVWGGWRPSAAHRSARARTASRELYLEYRGGGERHEAFFPDAAAIRAKVRMMLAQHPHLRGVYAWQMGQEDPASGASSLACSTRRPPRD